VKKSLILLVAFLMIGGVLVSGATEIASNNAKVSWKLEGCWAELNWRGGDNSIKWLGNISNYGIGTEVTSNADTHDLQARTNCRGYTVDVEATNFDLPTGHLDVPGTAIYDFRLTIDNWSDYKFFTDGFNVEKNMVTSSNAGTTNFDILYKYVVDEYDVSGDYVVHLKYTMSTN